jgi:hypothetical protein
MLRIGVLLLRKDGGQQAAYALSPQERGEGEELPSWWSKPDLAVLQFCLSIPLGIKLFSLSMSWMFIFMPPGITKSPGF